MGSEMCIRDRAEEQAHEGADDVDDGSEDADDNGDDRRDAGGGRFRVGDRVGFWHDLGEDKDERCHHEGGQRDTAIAEEEREH